MSLDGGRQWTRWSNGFPTVSVMDLAIHPRDSDLIIAHARAGALRRRRHLAAARSRGEGAGGEAASLPGRPTPRSTGCSAEDGGFGFGATEFRGENRPYGTPLTFVANGDDLPIADKDRDRDRRIAGRRREAATAAKSEGAKAESAAAADSEASAKKKADKEEAAKATLEIRDASGQRVRRLKVETKRGLNRVYWDLSRDAFKRPPSATPEEPDFNPSGPQVPPGRYEAVLTLAGEERRTPVQVLADPNSGNSAADWQARWAAILEAGALNDCGGRGDRAHSGDAP